MMFTDTGAAIGDTDIFGGRLNDGESSRERIGFAEVMSVCTGVVREHW